MPITKVVQVNSGGSKLNVSSKGELPFKLTSCCMSNSICYLSCHGAWVAAVGRNDKCHAKHGARYLTPFRLTSSVCGRFWGNGLGQEGRTGKIYDSFLNFK